MPRFLHDRVSFNYRQAGRGIPFVFQHGLGGDVNQPFGLFHPPAGFRVISFDCRAHGLTTPIGETRKIDIGMYANDCDALLNHLSIPSAIVGGISMGAALALEFALRFPARVKGLVLSRPAWLDRRRPAKGNPYLLIARLIRRHGIQRAERMFRESRVYKECLRRSPDAAASLLRQITQPRARETVIKLERIARYSPSYTRRQLQTICVPTLVLANRQDPLHPYEYGRRLARIVPEAEFRELTPKSISATAHAADVQKCVETFLRSHFKP